MAIDDSPFTFSELANRILPRRMQAMRQAMRRPFSMTLFGTRGMGPKTILRRLGRDRDFPGCYVLICRGKAIYVGISRGVIARLRQHVRGRTHFDASLAYRMASRVYRHRLRRRAAMRHRRFKEAFDRAQERLRSMKVAFIEIRSDLELYLFEAFCAMTLDTHRWNTFRTH